MNVKEITKNSLSVIALMALLVIPYLMNKKEREFNPFLLKLNTGNEVITLKELKDKHKVVLLYFGFLSCPDVCPTTLGTMASVFKDLPKERRDQIAFVFVDLDPERDKVEDLKTYTSFFDSKTIPVSLTLKELDLFTRYFGIVFMKVPLKSEMGYTVDHSTDIVVLSSEGKLLEPIHHGSPKVVILSQLNKIFEESNKKL